MGQCLNITYRSSYDLYCTLRCKALSVHTHSHTHADMSHQGSCNTVGVTLKSERSTLRARFAHWKWERSLSLLESGPEILLFGHLAAAEGIPLPVGHRQQRPPRRAQLPPLERRRAGGRAAAEVRRAVDLNRYLALAACRTTASRL